ncbi:MAG: S8 family serine peptidase [Actinomycetaceae bacterium]
MTGATGSPFQDPGSGHPAPDDDARQSRTSARQAGTSARQPDDARHPGAAARPRGLSRPSARFGLALLAVAAAAPAAIAGSHGSGADAPAVAGAVVGVDGLRTELPDGCTPEDIPTTVSPIFDQLGIEQAWELSRGEGVTVAVVDSGVVPSEPHLGDDVVLPGFDPMGTIPGSETVTEGPALSSNDGRTDVDSHGTTIAGLIAARQADGSMIEGIAPESRILPVRIFAVREGELAEDGYGPSVARMAEGIRWAADNGAQIISMSMSSTEDAPELREAVEHATAQGALVVASAGNATTTEEDPDLPRYPAAYPEVLAVTASDLDGLAVDASIPGEHVDIAAPGDVAWSVFLNEGECYQEGGASSSWSTGYVAAAAALVAARYPDETPAQWRYRLLVTAVRQVPEERTDLLGWGNVAPYDALVFVDDGSAPGPPSPVHEAPTEEAATFVPVPERPADPLEAVRGTAAWWVFGAFVVVGGAGLLAKTPRRRG